MMHNIRDNYFLAHFIVLVEMSNRIKADSFFIVILLTAISLLLLFFCRLVRQKMAGNIFNEDRRKKRLLSLSNNLIDILQHI